MAINLFKKDKILKYDIFYNFISFSTKKIKILLQILQNSPSFHHIINYELFMKIKYQEPSRKDFDKLPLDDSLSKLE